MTAGSGVPTQRKERFHGFWPLLLLEMSFLLMLCWEIFVSVQTRSTSQQAQEQQVRLADQAKQVELGLEKLVRGLVELSKTDDQAKALVTKFGIKINQPPVSGAAATP